MHHARTHHLYPLVAELLGHVITHQAHVDLDPRLDEREEARPKAHLDLRTLKQLFKKLRQRALEMRERDVGADYQPLYLKELRLVCHVGRLIAKDLARRDYPVGRQSVIFDHLLHITDLRIAGVRAQDLPRFVFDKKRVLHVARRVVLRHIKRVKVVPLVFNQGGICKRESHLKKYLIRFANERRNRVDTAFFNLCHIFIFSCLKYGSK